jgi:hypothetical protein
MFTAWHLGPVSRKTGTNSKEIEEREKWIKEGRERRK